MQCGGTMHTGPASHQLLQQQHVDMGMPFSDSICGLAAVGCNASCCMCMPLAQPPQACCGARTVGTAFIQLERHYSLAFVPSSKAGSWDCVLRWNASPAADS